MKRASRASRFASFVLSLALVHASFGPQAWGQTVAAAGEGSVSVGAAVAADTLAVSRAPATLAVGAFSATLCAAPAAPVLAAPVANPTLVPTAAASPAVGAASPPAVAATDGPVDVARSVAATKAADAPALVDRAAADGPSKSAPPFAEANEAGRALEIGGLLERRYVELKMLFAGRDDGAAAPNAPGRTNPPRFALVSAAKDEKYGPARSAALSPAAGTKTMLNRYVVASNSSQAGYELLASASMPVYLDQTFHNISMMADLSILGTFSSILGRQLSPLIVNSMPLKKGYVGMLAASGMIALTIGTLANLHALTVLPLFGLMMIYRTAQGGAAIAERSVIPSVLGNDQVAMEKLRGTKQSWAEVASVLVQNGAAVLVVVLGTATHNLLIAPFFYLAAVGLLWTSLRIPKAADDARLAAWREKSAHSGGGVLNRALGVFKNFGRQIGLGYRVVMRDPALRASAIATATLVLFNVLTYAILAPTFGKFAIGPGADSSLAAPIMGLIAGLFSFGGLFAGKIVNAHAAAVAAKYADDQDAKKEAARASTIRWLKYGALSFLAVGAMALPLPAVGPLIHLGSHAAIGVTAVLGTGTILSMWKPKLGLALAMAPVLVAFPLHVSLVAVSFFAFGLLQVAASLKNDSLFDKLVQERAPGNYANAAAFVGAFSMFAGMLGLTALKLLIYGSLPFGLPSPFPAFVGLPGIWPFVAIFGGLAVPAMLAMLRFSSVLNRQTRPADLAPHDGKTAS
jgi:hypothetical protein